MCIRDRHKLISKQVLSKKTCNIETERKYQSSLFIPFSNLFPFPILGFILQTFPRSRRRPPLTSLTAINNRQFSASENQEAGSMLIMSPTSSSERNKQTMLISDLNNRKVNSEKCNMISNVSAFEEGDLLEPQTTLGSEPTPSSWCSPLQLGNPRGKFN